jgi:hypothetical protein
MTRRSRFVLVCFALVSLAMSSLLGCDPARIAVSSNFDPLATFPAEATFTWKVDAQSLPEDPRLRTEAIDSLIRTAANEAFAKHGYRFVDSGPGDYVLSYQFRVHTWQAADESISTGTLSIEVAETLSGRRVWTGYGQAEIFTGLTGEESRKRLDSAMERMLRDFPPKDRPGI